MSGNHEWFTNVSEFDFNGERLKLIKNLDYLKSLKVTEFTFYKKWEELQQYKMSNIASSAEATERKIWTPTDINDQTLTIREIEDLDPEVIFVSDNSIYYDDWNNLRLFCHTMEYNQNPGRFLRFIIIDKVSKKYLGVISVASDVITITDRDNYIGWTSDNRLKDRRLAHSSIGSCIMATQPFGYNFLGAKLIACLSTTKTVRNIWESFYNQILVGMTTTSLYGSYSMYNNIPWWHKCGSSSGKILIKPDQSNYGLWHQWLKDNRPLEYEKAMTQKEGISGPVTAAKIKVLSMIMSECGIKQGSYVHGFLRGTYYSSFYENTKEFLQNKIQEKDLIIKPNRDFKSIMEWWRPKAINRFRKLFSENQIKTKTLFYLPMMDMTYEQAKNKYFNDVGSGK